MHRLKKPHAMAAAIIAAMTASGLAACTQVLGVDDIQLGECHPGDVQCKDDATLLTCNDKKRWSSTACDHQTCVGKECQGECGPADRQCTGTTPQRCQKDGLGWIDEEACPFVCSLDGRCTGVCVPEDVGCMNNKTRVCDKSGQWKDQQDCDTFEGKVRTCMDGMCIGVCKQGTKRCGGDTPELCDELGQWKPRETPCDVPNEVCQGGECKVACIPGDLRCEPGTDTPQLCDASTKTWMKNGPRCAPCVGCNDATGVCSTGVKPDGASCPTDDKCVLVATCQSGECVPAGSAGSVVQCLDGSPCSTDKCDPSTGNCAAADTDKCDDGNVCTAQSECTKGGCNPTGDHAWVHWDLTAAPPSRFTVVDYADEFEVHEVVLDNLTHLLWQRRWPDEKLSWEKARSLCEELTIKGYPKGSFRLPTRIELSSLVDYSKEFKAPLPGEPSPDISMDTTAFPWPSSENWTFWTSSSVAGDDTRAWVVGFNGGYVFYDVKDDPDTRFNVRCVH